MFSKIGFPKIGRGLYGRGHPSGSCRSSGSQGIPRVPRISGVPGVPGVPGVLTSRDGVLLFHRAPLLQCRSNRSQMFFKILYCILSLFTFTFFVYWEELFCKVGEYRSSHWRCSIKKDTLKNFAIFTEKHLCWSLF